MKDARATDLREFLGGEFSPRKESLAGTREKEILQRYNMHIRWVHAPLKEL